VGKPGPAALLVAAFFFNSFHRFLVKGLILAASLLAAGVSDYDRRTTDARLSFVCPTRDVQCRSHVMVNDRAVRELGFLSSTYSRPEYLVGVTPLACRDRSLDNSFICTVCRTVSGG
jgi:hypothetical protein